MALDRMVGGHSIRCPVLRSVCRSVYRSVRRSVRRCRTAVLLLTESGVGLRIRRPWKAPWEARWT